MTDRIRTEPSEEFAKGSVPIERFAAPADPGVRQSAVEQWAQAQMHAAEGQQLTPLGQVSEIWLYDRQIDFVRSGPLLAMNHAKQLVIPTPVYSLPSRRVLVDRKNRPVWNIEKLPPGERYQVMQTAQFKEMAPKLESFATAKTRDGRLYVLQPLTQILIKTVDQARRPIFVNILPGNQGVNAALLYDPTSGQLQIWGGEFFQFA